jgi:glyoxylase-like metal-dependent hydrolase (beta-lactamase superfamily II)
MRHGRIAPGPEPPGASRWRGRHAKADAQAMEAFICVTCGAQFAATPEAPARCPICDDERQYVGQAGQRWTTQSELRRDHRNDIHAIEPGLTGIATEPKFAIGQQAHLIETPAGNLLWNCIDLIDDATVAAIERRGGLAAIAVSHPHFFTAVADWSRAFGGVPVFLHADDRQWVTRLDDAIRFWDGETFEPLPGSGLTLIRCGGHFPGSCALHWPAGAGGAGALLTGDTITVVADRRWVSFMYSYPNLIPLDADAIRRIDGAVKPYPFDRLYGGWAESVVPTDAKNAVRRSAARYLDRIGAASPDRSERAAPA